VEKFKHMNGLGLTILEAMLDNDPKTRFDLEMLDRNNRKFNAE